MADGALTKDIFSLLIRSRGKLSVNIHLRNKDFTNLAFIKENNDQESICFDMILDINTSVYQTYVVMKKKD